MLPDAGPMERAPRPDQGARIHKNGTRKRASPNPAGNPPYVPTEAHRRMVTVLKGGGVDIHIIAELLGIAKSTVERHFDHELKLGKDLTIARVAGRVVQKALAGDNQMMVFYLRHHGGEQWKDRQRIEHAGADGGLLVPPQLVVSFITPGDGGGS